MKDLVWRKKKDTLKVRSQTYQYKFHMMSYLVGTICNWLHICGFRVTESKKGIYYDGHERPDVVEVRQSY